MIDTTRSAREELAATFADRGLSAEQVTAIVDGMTDEQVTDSLVMLAEVAAERDALRARLAADPVLRRPLRHREARAAPRRVRRGAREQGDLRARHRDRDR
jgi:hypothetical protein